MEYSDKAKNAIFSELKAFYLGLSQNILYTKNYSYSFMLHHDDVLDRINKDAGHIIDLEKKRIEARSSRRSEWIDSIGVVSIIPYMANEINNGSPYLTSSALINAWSICEAKVDDIAITMLFNFPKLLEHPDFSNISGKLSEFVVLSKKERTRFIFDEFRIKIDKSKKKGVGRFEAILEPVGLGGGVDEISRRLFVEMAEIRNNLVHRMGVVDAKLAINCPWLNLKPNTKYSLSLEKLLELNYCMKHYILLIDARFRKLIGEETPKCVSDFTNFHKQNFEPVEANGDLSRRIQ